MVSAIQHSVEENGSVPFDPSALIPLTIHNVFHVRGGGVEQTNLDWTNVEAIFLIVTFKNHM